MFYNMFCVIVLIYRFVVFVMTYFCFLTPQNKVGTIW